MLPLLRPQRRYLQSFSHKRYNQAAVAQHRPLPSKLFNDSDAKLDNDTNNNNDNQQTRQRQQQQRQQQNNSQSTAKNQLVSRQQQQHFDKDQLDLSFNNTKLAFKSKKFSQLLRNYVVLGLCSSNILVKNNETLMKSARKLLGKRGFELLMKSTFYGQFVAGNDEIEIQPTIAHLSRFGVKALIDYSAEEDVASDNSDSADPKSLINDDFANRRKYSPVARTYFYHGESQCEKNLEIFFRAIEAVADATDKTGLVAIKLTALGRPQLLMKLSKIVDFMLKHDTGGGGGGGGGTVENIGKFSSLAELLNAFKSLDNNKFANVFDDDEEEMLCNLMRRVNRIAAYAHEKKVRCMIDAEQTYMQSAINAIAIELMREFNKSEAIVFNTYQCYLKSAFERAVSDLALAKAENFYFGAKLVRGAYMEQERQRAKQLNYADPINDSFEATTQMYKQTLSYLMDEIVECRRSQNQAIDEMSKQNRKISIMVASHNEDTVRFAVEQMAALGIEPEHRVICFGQLYGMCDHVSFSLGQAGYSVYKYMPYGPLEEVLPYLGRRAIENNGFLSKLQRERSLIAEELFNRLVRFQWFYKPQGNYKVA